MTRAELTEWMGLWRIDPWGRDRGDLGPAITSSLLANVHRDARRRPKPYAPVDFMPYVEQPPVNPAAELRAAFADRVVKGPHPKVRKMIKR